MHQHLSVSCFGEKILGYDIYLIDNKQIEHATYANKQWFPSNEQQCTPNITFFGC